MKKLAILILLILFAVALSPTLAQDVTPEATPAETPVDGPDIIINNPPPAVDPNDVGFTFYQIILAFTAGGLVGLGGGGVLASRLLKNKDALDAMERIATSTIPINVLPIINKLAESTSKIAELVEKITDQQPNVVYEDAQADDGRKDFSSAADPYPPLEDLVAPAPPEQPGSVDAEAYYRDQLK